MGCTLLPCPQAQDKSQALPPRPVPLRNTTIQMRLDPPTPAVCKQTHLDISRCSQTKALFFEVDHLKTLDRSSIFRGPFH